jgi:hypothetical protein
MKNPADFDQMGDDKWQKGLCHSFAEALQVFLSRGQIGAIWVNDGFKHVYVSDAGFAYDSRAVAEKEEDFWSRWRLKYGAEAMLSKVVVPKVRDLEPYDVKFGDTWDSTLYAGPEYGRWLTEAKEVIRQNEFFHSLAKA